MKNCGSCGELKSVNDYHKNSKTKDGLQSRCKSCNLLSVKSWQKNNPEKHKNIWERATSHRSKHTVRSRRYDIHPDDLLKLLVDSGGFCDICGESDKKGLVVDHCHRTNVVRGIICENCNRGLGMFKDSTFNLLNAVGYLTKNKTKYRKYSLVERSKYMHL